jgi:hypothetical protein
MSGGYTHVVGVAATATVVVITRNIFEIKAKNLTAGV